MYVRYSQCCSTVYTQIQGVYLLLVTGHPHFSIHLIHCHVHQA